MTAPDGLAVRGSALWFALGRQPDTPAGALALEACRTVDRLDRLNGLLTDCDEWFDLLEKPEGSGHYVITVNNAIAEARQQSLALTALLKALGADASPAVVTEETSPLAQVLALTHRAKPSGGSA